MNKKAQIDIYEKSGVSYKTIDPVKKLAQISARLTSDNLTRLSEKEVAQSRGESAYVYDCGDHYRAFVIEGLGTKNLVADEMEAITGKTYYSAIAQDAVATIINDLVTVGAKPEVISAYFAVGNSSWFLNKKRTDALITGWEKACNIAGATWAGGETPTLPGIVNAKTIEIGGASTGVINPKQNLIIGDNLKAGDIIILIESSGIHANGLTLVRKIAKKLKKGFATIMPSGKMFGEAILSPTIIYAEFIENLQKEKVDIHYAVNITGHGWRKLMRHTKKFTYIINNIPQPQEEFLFIQNHGKISDEEMYGNFNMGAGFVIFINPKDLAQVEKVSKLQKIKIYNAGVVNKGPKQVKIVPKSIIFREESLNIR